VKLDIRASGTIGNGDAITPRVRMRKKPLRAAQIEIAARTQKAQRSKTGQSKSDGRGPYVQVCISVGLDDLILIDAAAERAGMSRSSFIVSSALTWGASMDAGLLEIMATIKRRIGK
jgi:hypothetical protein